MEFFHSISWPYRKPLNCITPSYPEQMFVAFITKNSNLCDKYLSCTDVGAANFGFLQFLKCMFRTILHF